MARGRMISRTLGTSSRRFAALTKAGGKLAEFAQALYPMLIVHSDDHGRMHGDPFTIQNSVWPTSPRQEADFEKALDALFRVGLIDRYENNGVIYLSINDFDEHQSGLHKRRESKFPEPPGTPRNAPEIPGRTEQNRTEQEGEQKGTPARRDEDGEADFTVFYAAYPRKVGKADAEKAWKQSGLKQADLPTVLAAIANQRGSPQWAKDEGQFIPHPATWLRRRGWEDQAPEFVDEFQAARTAFVKGKGTAA